VKGVLIPGFLLRALERVQARREVEPFIGFSASLLLGAAGTAFALTVGGYLPLAPGHEGGLAVSASLATLFTGLLVIITRRKAITQVVGYLALENGIFIFGLPLVGAVPLLVEAGLLLDLVAGIFIMAIVLHRIQREFSSLDTHRLSSLKE
jgi:hydrogenase-4 component E